MTMKQISSAKFHQQEFDSAIANCVKTHPCFEGFLTPGTTFKTAPPLWNPEAVLSTFPLRIKFLKPRGGLQNVLGASIFAFFGKFWNPEQVPSEAHVGGTSRWMSCCSILRNCVL